MSSRFLRPARLVGAACLALISAACAREDAPAPEPRLVRSIVVRGGTSGESTTYTAEIRSRLETDLSFQVGGKIVSRAVDVGANVRKGQALAQIDQTDQRLGVDAATSAVAAARAELDRARSEEARHRDLLERGLTTRASYLAQQTSVKTSQSRLEQATADLRLSQQKLGYTTLRADQDGVVTSIMAEVGSVVAAGQRIVSIARPSELEAVFDVPDGRIDEIRGATAVQFAFLSNPDTRYPARVREISPSADPVTRTYQVKTAIPNAPASLRLGMNVSVVLPYTGSASSIALPASALFQQGRDPAVWLVKADHTLELRGVTVERYESDRVYVSEGLSAGDRVVTAGVHRLAAGEKVRLLEDKAAAEKTP
ncbi:MAG TPA: efflux RND transporter periplasmic adaptor subunit [Steroidobacteraceae bacterium]|nr:efflux RND transporter periplasmic adaptor subunit [Steroidobacteraceae bacterium]